MSAFRLEYLSAGPPGPAGPGEIAHLVMDDPARKVNVLDEAAIGDLETALGELEARAGLRGLVLLSGKKGSFNAGADVDAVAGLTDRARVRAIVQRAQQAFGRLAALPFPTVAAIDGVCLGGGTEMALACDSRLASDEPRTRIGLPEALLGIIPGWGGTTRLPRLVGLSTALDLVLSGRALDARRAERAGLVARAVPAAWLEEHAHRRLAELAARGAAGRRDRWRPRGPGAWLLDGTPVGRGIAFARARAMAKARGAGHYPASAAALSVLQHGFGQPVDVSQRLEAEWVSDLVVGPVCKNLIRLFQLTERARRAPVGGAGAAPAEVRRFQLVGTGVMGAGIAELVSREGVEVRMRDTDPAALARALRAVRARMAERSGRGTRRHELEAQCARLVPTLDLAGLRRADFALEAVIEDLDVKRRVLAELEVRVRPDTVLATNTSSLSVDELAAGLEHPERMVGMHFFNPVHRMPLVEVVRGARTSDAALATAVALARRLGKTPVVVGDAPGFVVNRVLMPYLREALHLLEEGFTVADVDGAMREFGMPMGPLEVLDEVGLEVAARVAVVLAAAFPGRMSPAPPLEALVKTGRLGRKSGAGFYRHAGRRREPDPQVPRLIGVTRQRRTQGQDTLAERMTLAMVNEAARVLAEGLVEDAGMLDLAMVTGIGFPPFRGGPLRHADAVGLAKVQARLMALRAAKGERFEPAPLLAELVAAGGTFTQPPPAA